MARKRVTKGIINRIKERFKKTKQSEAITSKDLKHVGIRKDLGTIPQPGYKKVNKQESIKLEKSIGHEGYNWFTRKKKNK